MYVALYAFVACVALAGLILGVSQMTVGGEVYGFWLVPGAAVLAGFIWGMAFIGQGFGGEQMYELRLFLRETVRGCDLDYDCDFQLPEEPKEQPAQ